VMQGAPAERPEKQRPLADRELRSRVV